MDIEVADIRKINGDSKLKAYADVRVGGVLIIKGFGVMKGKNGVFVAMPRKPGKEGKWFDTLAFTDEVLKEEVQNKVLKAYSHENDGIS